MVISHSKKFIFIHIYKTAGTSVSYNLMPYARIWEKISGYWPSKKAVAFVNKICKLSNEGNKWINGVHKHATAQQIKNFLGADLFNQYFKFTFVRNPYDLQVSLYHYIRASRRHRYNEVANRLSFKEFMHNEIAAQPPRQIDFISDEANDLLVDFIGKTETVEENMQYICSHLDLDCVNLPKKNVSQRMQNYKEYYDRELEELVYNYFQKDFKVLDYPRMFL